MVASIELRRIAGALATYWAGGDGPTRAQIQSALLVAGYQGSSEGNKQQLVQQAISEAEDDTARVIIEELLSLLRESGYFRAEDGGEPLDRLRRSVANGGHELDEEGFVTWASPTTGRAPAPSPNAIPIELPALPSQVASSTDKEVPLVREVSSPDIDLLVSSLRRLGSGASRPLIARRRSERPSISVGDEYDVQDLVEFLLRLLFSDVRPEEPTPTSAGSSSRIDFHLREGRTAVEVKVTSRRHGEREIKAEVLMDINDYKNHPKVDSLVIAIYDFADRFENPAGFEHDLSGDHSGLQVRVIVVPWVGRTTQ